MRRLLLALALVLGTAGAARARPGGGHLFSSGRSSRSSSRSYSGSRTSFSHPYSGGRSSRGSGGDGGLFDLFVFLFRYPYISLPIALFIGYRVWRSWRRVTSLDIGSIRIAPVVPPRPAMSPRQRLARLFAADADFSVVVFEDFLYALYAQAHVARGRNELERLSAYLSPGARASLIALGPGEVKDVVVGAMRYVSVGMTHQAVPAKVRVGVEIEANYTQGDARTFVAERWLLVRSASARSRAPDRARALVCPSCGAALTEIERGRCAHCGQQVDSGDFDWVVSAIMTTERTRQPPVVGGYPEERGTDLPTVHAPDLAERLSELGARDPDFTVEAFQARVQLVFAELQRGWSARDWKPMRPYLSDALFDSQLYWIEAYRRQGLRNVTDKARIERFELAAVHGDRWFDAITVRLFATGLDYTLRDDGKLVGGSRTRERRYSEYWTLIRGGARRGRPPAAGACPNCGAELKINMTGSCEYCDAKVTSGSFDWVLSRIEQDDVYEG